MLLVLVLPSALVPATMAFSSVFPQVGRRRKARTETAAWSFPSTSVSSGRDSSDWDREKGDFFWSPETARGTEHPQSKGDTGWKEGGYTQGVTSPEGTEVNSPAALGDALNTGSSTVYFHRIIESFRLEKTFNIIESNLAQSPPNPYQPRA